MKLCKLLSVLVLAISFSVHSADYRDKWLSIEQKSNAANTKFATGLEWESLESIEAQASKPSTSDLELVSGRSVVDLSSQFPAPGSQGSQSSCVGWALAYIHSYYDRRLTGNGSMSSPAWIFNQIQKNGCDNGSYIRDGMVLMNEHGVLKNSEHPYNDRVCTGAPSLLFMQAQKRRLAGFAVLDPANLVKHTKVHLDAGIPVAIGFKTYGNFISWGPSNQEYQKHRGIYRAVGRAYVGGHAMAVVGFDDKRRAMKVINSWGTEWGSGGYAWIDYEIFERYVKYAYAAYTSDQPSVGGVNFQQYDGIRIYGEGAKESCDSNQVLTGASAC